MPFADNPLRGLTMSRAVTELEAGQRGDLSNLQWLYQMIERRDATLRGAKRRIQSAVLKLEWDIKIQSGLSALDYKEAERQKVGLKARYRKMKGFRPALKHLALAEFRGFSHVEKRYDQDGEVIALEPVPQWHWCKDGFYGQWLYQADALRGGVTGLPIDPANFIIREVEDPINEIALVAFTRKGLSSKDFDAFVARYGIPFVYWILSDVMAATLANEPTKLAEWMKVMRGIGSDGEGIIPGGTIETLDHRAGGSEDNVFLQHLGYQDEQIVMAATSGKLTMLSEATGIGGGATNAHQNTFDEIALALAMEISETFHEQVDMPILAKLFPGQAPLVYFELAAKKSKDVQRLINNVSVLDSAGWQIDAAELCEKTGFKLRRKGATTPPPQPAHKVNTTAAAEKTPEQKNRDASDPLKLAAARLLNEFGKHATDALAADICADTPATAAGPIERPPITDTGLSDLFCRGRFRDLTTIGRTPKPWIHMVPRGEFPGMIDIPAGYDVPGYGVATEDMEVQVMTVLGDQELESIVRSFRGDMLIDPDHLSHDPDHNTEAMGWGHNIRYMTNRADGLEVKTDWTPLGTDKINQKIYRFISPEFAGAVRFEDGVFRFYPGALTGAGLTNRPKLKTLRSVTGGRENQHPPSNTL